MGKLSFTNRLGLAAVLNPAKRSLARGDDARDRRDWSAAAAEYQNYLCARPNDFAIWVQLGHAHKELGQFDKALTAYKNALELKAEDADLLLNFGHLHKLMGDRGSAASFYHQSHALDGNPQAQAELRRLAAGAPINGHPQGVAGYFEGLVGNTAIGWARNPASPNVPAAVEFLIDGEVIHTSVADSFREDLEVNGVGRAGFRIELPLGFDHRGAHRVARAVRIHARLAGTNTELQLSPKEAVIYQPQENLAPVRVQNPSSWPLPAPSVRAIAYYLPQFHPFPENNEWWGAGFTEWTNVTRATPQFDGHNQPRRPGELGYYDLRLPEVQERQAELAALYGLSGFCFYFYWFDGKILMERPIKQFSNNKNITLPFCLCWANENWTRRWDGLDNEILIAQNYEDGDDLRFIKHISKYFRTPKYIRVDNKPLLIVYRAELLPDAKRTAEVWRNYCRKIGIGEIYLACTHSFAKVDPREFGFDSALEFPPNNMAAPQLNPADFDGVTTFSGKIHDYVGLIPTVDTHSPPDYPLIRGVFSGWDNTARRKNAGTIFANSSPEDYMRYLELVARQVIERQDSPDERLVFINAWNEWAEGAYLEPDERHGYAYLEATRMALIRAGASAPGVALQRFGPRDERPRLAVVVHAYYLDVLSEMLSTFRAYEPDVEFYFSTTPNQVSALEAILSSFTHKYEIISTENRGRDVAPFLKTLSLIWHRKFQYILKLHTKKSTHRNDGDVWRNDMLRALAAPRQVSAILQEMDRKPDVGIVGPAEHVLPMNYYWGSNGARVLELSRRFGVEFPNVNDAPFVAGTMFFARIEALEPLLGLSLTLKDFETEAGQVDGTLAHAIERAITFSAAAVSMKVCGARISDGASPVLTDRVTASTYDFAAPTLENGQPAPVSEKRSRRRKA